MEGTRPVLQRNISMSSTGGNSISGAGPLSGIALNLAVNSSRSISMASISSEGSTESHLVEQEEIAALTHDVRNFKEALGKLRRIFNPDRDKQETLKVAAHERLGDVLRILRSVLDKYPALQSTELLVSAGTLIQHVKGYSYDDEKSDPKEFFESIDQLALAFSSRVSEYLMGDLDTNISLSSSVSSKTKSCENLASDVESSGEVRDEKKPDSLTPQQIDGTLHQLEQGVEYALHRAKLWSKYAKDVMMYIEKRAHLEMEYSKNLTKLAQTVRPLLKEEGFMPFQSIYCTALDQDIDNSNSSQVTCSLLLGHKFIEPLTIRRNEHERTRKQLKETWHRELKHMHEAVSSLRKAKAAYIQRQQEYERAREAAQRAAASTGVSGDGLDPAKLDKRKRLEDDARQKATDAEITYKTFVQDANKRHQKLQEVKADVLRQVRELILQCDQTMKAVTVSYFQLQHTLSTPAPIQFQTLCESSRLYEPGSQYMEFVKRLQIPAVQRKDSGQLPFSFEAYTEGSTSLLEKERKSTGSIESEDFSQGDRDKPSGIPHMKAWSPSAQVLGSDTDSISSSHSNKSRDTSPTASPMIPARKIVTVSSGDELEAEDTDGGYLSYSSNQRPCMSKAAVTHTFRKLKTPSRCRECDSYVYFQGAECSECGLACHKKCLETLAIQCGHKRLPRKMTTFGVDLGQHLAETQASIPHIVCKCVHEIDSRGKLIKGIYRVSGVKSKVEKLCQAFENGAELVDLTDIHPNVIANVLKLYLRQLPEPLLTFRLYSEFVRIAKEYPSISEYETKQAVTELRELTKKLPKHHHLTLAFLMQHLKRVSEDSSVNNMPPSNLGIVFGPTLLRTSEGSASLSSLVDTVHQTRAIELIINYSDDIFNNPEIISSIKEYSTKYQKTDVILSRSFSFMSEKSKKVMEQDILSTPTDRRGEVQEEITLPGYIGEKGVTVPQESEFMQIPGDDPLSGPTSDDELPDFLLPDDSTHTKKSPLMSRGVSVPAKIFKGSLRDYQGLEGFASMMSSTESSEHVHPKLRKSISDITPDLHLVTGDRTTLHETLASETGEHFSVKSITKLKKSVSAKASIEGETSGFGDGKMSFDREKTSAEEGGGEQDKLSAAEESESRLLLSRKHSPKLSQMSKLAGRTESSVDSDYSFESHASSSVESRSPREYDDDDGGVKIGEQDQSGRRLIRGGVPGRQKESGESEGSERVSAARSLDNLTSPTSSLSYSMDESQGSDAADDLDGSLRKSISAHTTSSSTGSSSGHADYLTNIPAYHTDVRSQGMSVSSSKISTIQTEESQEISVIKGQKLMGFEENKVKIQVPGKSVTTSSRMRSTYQSVAQAAKMQTICYRGVEHRGPSPLYIEGSKSVLYSEKEAVTKTSTDVSSDSGPSILEAKSRSNSLELGECTSLPPLPLRDASTAPSQTSECFHMSTVQQTSGTSEVKCVTKVKQTGTLTSTVSAVKEVTKECTNILSSAQYESTKDSD